MKSLLPLFSITKKYPVALPNEPCGPQAPNAVNPEDSLGDCWLFLRLPGTQTAHCCCCLVLRLQGKAI